MLKAISEARQAATIAISGTVMGAVWIGGGLGFLILLRELPDHGRLARRHGAGRRLGGRHARVLRRPARRPAQDGAAHVSPGKTWEGFVFGTAATVFVAFVALYKQHFLTIGQSIVLGVVLAIAAPLGDLFESLLKRDMDVKDTGTLLGGHGGMLDRIDAFLFAAPAAYFAILAFTDLTVRRWHTVGMKRVALLGATGSIGRQALEVIEAHPSSSSSPRPPARRRSTALRRSPRWAVTRPSLLERAEPDVVLNATLGFAGLPGDDVGARARRDARAREQGEPRCGRRARARPRGSGAEGC